MNYEILANLPALPRKRVEPLLSAGEFPLAVLEVDLDARLRFSTSWAILTNRRLLAVPAGEVPADATVPGGWDAASVTGMPASGSWDLAEAVSLRARTHAGVGRLELCGPDGLWACWRFTAGRLPAALRMVQKFESRGQEAAGSGPMPSASSVCPGCGAVIDDNQTQCTACQPAPSPPAWSSLARLTTFARPRAPAVALGFMLAFAATAAGLVPPYLTKPLLDDVLIPHQNGVPVDFHLVAYYLLALAGAALLAWLLSWGRTYVLAWVSERIAADMRTQTYAHLQCLSLDFFGGKRTGDLIARLGADTDRICYFLSVNLLDFGTDVLMIGMTSVILLCIDPWLAVVTLFPFPLIAWLIHQVRSRLRRGFDQGGRAWAEMTSVLADTIPGVRVVKAFAQEGREVQRFRRANDFVLAANDRVNSTWSFFGPVVTLLTEAGLLIIWACGAWRVAQDHITVGVLTAFLAYISRFYNRLESMSRMLAATQRAAASAQRVFEILDRQPSVPEPARPVHVGRLRGQIEVRNVGFKYGSRRVLSGVNLTIRPGEMIGLVGPSGAGKSTLANLVCRFYDVSEGAILVDGIDVRSLAIADFRRNIGIVLQDPFLFYGTIAENIAYGRPDASRAEIVAAARAARAHEFILRLADGYDSLVGERGQALSGGERQRISIARALLIDPAILILDEATSSVDTETEREIQEALDNLIQGRTTIAIAHRLSTLRKADRVVVMERGRVAEVGHHQELLLSDGVYARLHRAQLQLVHGAAGDSLNG